MKYSPWLSCWDEEPIDADEEGVEAETQHGHGAPVEVPRPEIELKWNIVNMTTWHLSISHLRDMVEAHEHHWGEDENGGRDK